jgi:4-amino-4-deoxy-L-arabinose transferase-like glycosyltransferase
MLNRNRSAVAYTPVRLIASATKRLPTVWLLLIATLYILLGLFDRAPWKTDDVIGLATMLSALNEGHIAWLIPHIGSTTLTQNGPLPMWVGAAFMWMLEPLISHIAAARVAVIFWFAVMLWALWYGTYLLGRRNEGQPLALPFGGEPTPRAYGRLLADVSALFLMATVGVLLRLHETSEAPALMAIQALILLGAIRMLDKPFQGSMLIGAALGGAFLTRGLPATLPLVIGLIIVLLPHKPMNGRKKWVVWSVSLGFAISVAWLYLAQQADSAWADEWWHWNSSLLGLGGVHDIFRPLRDLPWFIWPTWPLALMATWNWRRTLTAPHIWLPLSFFIAQLVGLALTSNPGELDYVSLAIPSAMLAAFAVPTMRRGMINTLDWFALMCFSVTTTCVWVGWFTQQTGFPAGIAHNIARQTVGYEPVIVWPAVAMGAVVSGVWLLTMRWRLVFQPTALWRGALLCATGITATWALLVLLWLPTVDYVRSYQPMSAAIHQALLKESTQAGQLPCVRAFGVSEGVRASLYVFDNLTFSYSSECKLILQQTTIRRLLDRAAGFEDNATVIWQGSRGADRFDRYRLLKLNP